MAAAAVRRRTSSLQLKVIKKKGTGWSGGAFPSDWGSINAECHIPSMWPRDLPRLHHAGPWSVRDRRALNLLPHWPHQVVGFGFFLHASLLSFPFLSIAAANGTDGGCWDEQLASSSLRRHAVAVRSLDTTYQLSAFFPNHDDWHCSFSWKVSVLHMNISFSAA